jgi:hypothetical protein
MRDNPALAKWESETDTLYTGYVAKENGELATQIYDKLEPLFKGYLSHLRSKRTLSYCTQPQDW